MGKSVEFYFDVGSPASYLAWTQLPALCRQHGAELVYKPMLLGGVFQATGNASPGTVLPKGRYMDIDLGRFARRYGVPLVMNPHFPINTLMLMRLILGVQLRQPQRFEALLTAVFQAMWVDAKNMNDLAVATQVLADAGFSQDEVGALAADPQVKTALKSQTEEAVGRGVFGAPTMFIGKEMYFGQDRLDFVRETLA